MLSRIKQTGLCYLWLSLIIIFFDQITKMMIINFFELYQFHEVSSFFNIVRVHNQGAAFSFLADQNGWQKLFLITVSSLVSIYILYELTVLSKQERLLSVAFCCILGGALGNLIDRVFYGYVVDFLDFHYVQWHWPAFNVADIAITIGAFLFILDMILGKKYERK